MDAAKRLTAIRPPFWTLLVCFCAALIFRLPALQQLLIYKRVAIDHGELWRLATGHLVHLSPAHLCFDLSAFFIAGAIIEILGYRRLPMLCLFAAAFIGIILYCAEPSLSYYGGLSGVAMAAVTYLCLQGLMEKGAWRRLCAVVLAGVAAKVVFEFALGKSLLSEVGARGFVPVPLSHLAGTIAALLFFVLMRFSELKTRDLAAKHSASSI